MAYMSDGDIENMQPCTERQFRNAVRRAIRVLAIRSDEVWKWAHELLESATCS